MAPSSVGVQAAGSGPGKDRPRILILRGGTVGDFILTLPAIEAIRRRWPDGCIEIVARGRIAELAVAAGLADRTGSLDAATMARLFAENTTLPEDQRTFIGSFDHILSYLHDADGVVAANLRRAGARHLVSASPLVRHGHAVEHLNRPLAEFGIVEAPAFPRLNLGAVQSARGRDLARAAGHRLLAIHPGSGGHTKNWPLPKFMELADRAARKGLTPLFTAGEADGDIEARLRNNSRGHPIVAGCSLLELAGALSACVGYVGNDSGITHLAAALGVPVVAVFGPTDPEMWGPRGGTVRIVRAADHTGQALASVAVDQVLGELEELLRGAAGLQ